MNERSERSKRISEGMMRHWAQRKKVDQSHDRRLSEIRARLAGVDPTKPWKYNPEHEMFVGTTNALEMYRAVYGHDRCTCPSPRERKADLEYRVAALERRLLDLEKAYYSKPNKMDHSRDVWMSGEDH